MKRVLLTGSRDWPEPRFIEHVLEALWTRLGPFVLVHGDARGADRIGADYQDMKGRPSEAHPADWDRYGKRAGFIRNAEMVALGADLCLAFIHNESRGATMCADLAEKNGIKVRRFT